MEGSSIIILTAALVTKPLHDEQAKNGEQVPLPVSSLV